MNQVKKFDPSFFTPFVKQLARNCMPYLPVWVTPNQITVFGFVAFLMADIAFYLARFTKLWLFVVVAGLLIHWFTDELDGEYARMRNLTSERGFFLDIILDVLGAVGWATGVACGGFVQPVLLATYLVLYLLGMVLSLLIIILRQEFHISKLGPEELYAAAVIMIVLIFVWGGPIVRIAGYGLQWFDLLLLVALPISIVEWLKVAIWLYQRLEPPRRQ